MKTSFDSPYLPFPDLISVALLTGKRLTHCSIFLYCLFAGVHVPIVLPAEGCPISTSGGEIVGLKHVRIEVLYAFEVITVREVLFVVNILNRVKTVHKIGKKVKISTRRVRFFFLRIY
jgi:hypothetical protein